MKINHLVAFRGSRKTSFFPNVAVYITILFACNALAQNTSLQPCGDPFLNHFGPWDFRTAPKGRIETVEKFHFTPGVESMTAPATTTPRDMAADVAYTLHVFPNHHRALLTMARLGERHRSELPPGASYSVDCYFQRAVIFQPDDTVARSLYAIYLGKQGRKDSALSQLRVAAEYAADSAISHYNIGLIFFDLGEQESALSQAHKAQKLGLERSELSEKLRAVQKWRDLEK